MSACRRLTGTHHILEHQRQSFLGVDNVVEQHDVGVLQALQKGCCTEIERERERERETERERKTERVMRSGALHANTTFRSAYIVHEC